MSISHDRAPHSASASASASACTSAPAPASAAACSSSVRSHFVRVVRSLEEARRADGPRGRAQRVRRRLAERPQNHVRLELELAACAPTAALTAVRPRRLLVAGEVCEPGGGELARARLGVVQGGDPVQIPVGWLVRTVHTQARRQAGTQAGHSEQNRYGSGHSGKSVWFSSVRFGSVSCSVRSSSA